MSRFLHPRYETLEAYTPGEQPRDRAYIKLNTNESPYPPSPQVLSTITQEEVENLRLYSDPEGKILCDKLAGLYKLSPKNVFLSNGSDDILNFAFMAFGQAGAAFPTITYSFYPVFGELHGVPCERIPLRKDFSIEPSDYFGKNKLLLITNPNAPTGMALFRMQIRRIVEANPHSVVLVDEAYVDFGAESCAPLVSEYSNLLVVMTYSKSRSLAGARLGFALGNAELIADLNLLKYSTNPYNVNRLTLAIGAAAVDSDAYFRANCARIIETRENTTKALESLGFCVLPSKANFLFTKREGISGAALYQALKARGILIRHFNKEPIADFIRVTIGTNEEMAAFLSATQEILREEGLL